MASDLLTLQDSRNKQVWIYSTSKPKKNPHEISHLTGEGRRKERRGVRITSFVFASSYLLDGNQWQQKDLLE